MILYRSAASPAWRSSVSEVADALLRAPIAGIQTHDVLTQSVCNQLHIHAMESYPNECVGYVKDGAYHRLENVSPEPAKSAVMSPDDLVRVLDLEPDAICHSHPDGPDCPSSADMVFQRQTGVPHAIVSTNGEACMPAFLYGDGVAKPPLLGRPFRHGVTDCFDLLRDFYKIVMGVDLEPCPRDWDWWSEKDAGEGLYLDNYRKWGFEPMHGPLEVGDVFLLRAGAKMPNHCGIYIGSHLMIHHLSGRFEVDASRLSVKEPMVRWQQHGRLTDVMRYRG